MQLAPAQLATLKAFVDGDSGLTALRAASTISPNIVCGSGITPTLTAGTVVTED